MTAPTLGSPSLAPAAPVAVRPDVVPAEVPARLLRCVGERPVPALEAYDAAVPRHLAPRRPMGRPAAAVPPADPRDLCCSVVRAAVEVLRGERTVHQLARWVTPEIYDALAKRARLVLEAAGTSTGAAPAVSRPVTVRRARVVRLGSTVAEATVVLEDDDRVRAAAARLELRRGSWRVVALEIG